MAKKMADVSFLASDQEPERKDLYRHTPDPFEKRFGVIGGNYNSPEGLRRVSDGSLCSVTVPANWKLTECETRILSFLEEMRSATIADLIKGCQLTKATALGRIQPLITRGLVSRRLVGKKFYYKKVTRNGKS